MTYQLNQDQRNIYHRFATLALPRHTSYPAVPYWTSEFPANLWVDELKSITSDISLYIHVPYCEKLCYYCGCTKNIVSKINDQTGDLVEGYLRSLIKELDRVQLALEENRRTVVHVHFGGGTPTYLSPAQLEYVFEQIQKRFELSLDAEIACEIDPRATTTEHLRTLKRLGFNRLSLGIQDFDSRVQKAVNRIQPFAQVANFVSQCRNLGFDSINFDLIYGLPFQTRESIADTLLKVIHLNPDRLAYYRLAHIPELFRWQRAFGQSDMPSVDETLDFNLMAINEFQNAGYEFIGLDHFAKSSDRLSKAYKSRTLQRNFQGMSNHANISIIGLGPSAISSSGRVFAQNEAKVNKWQSRIDEGFATARGLKLSFDDKLRNEVLQELYCYRSIDFKRFGQRYGSDFREYFHREMRSFEDLASEGLLVLEADKLTLTQPLGELLIRVVGASLDAYLQIDSYKTGSKKGSSVG